MAKESGGTSALQIGCGVAIGLVLFFFVLPLAMCGGCGACGLMGAAMAPVPTATQPSSTALPSVPDAGARGKTARKR